MLTATDPRSIELRVTALANIGVILRKQGELRQSVEILDEAVATARRSTDDMTEPLCYALDNLGFSLLRTDSAPKAVVAFEESLGARRDAGLLSAVPQSTVNLAHAAMQSQDYGRAADLFKDALADGAGERDNHVTANALCGVADARLRRGDSDVAAELGEALRLNIDLHNSDGLSITHALMARLHLATGNEEEVLREVEECEAECGKSGNLSGRGTAAWLRAELAMRQGGLPSAPSF